MPALWRFSIVYDDHPDWTCPAFATYEEAFDRAGKRTRAGDGPVVVIEWVDGQGSVTRCRRQMVGPMLETHTWDTLDTGKNEARRRSTYR